MFIGVYRPIYAFVFNKIAYEDAHWTHLAQDMVQWLSIMMTYRVSQMGEELPG
jgi:hypothetical protein